MSDPPPNFKKELALDTEFNHTNRVLLFKMVSSTSTGSYLLNDRGTTDGVLARRISQVTILKESGIELPNLERMEIATELFKRCMDALSTVMVAKPTGKDPLKLVIGVTLLQGTFNESDGTFTEVGWTMIVFSNNGAFPDGLDAHIRNIWSVIKSVAATGAVKRKAGSDHLTGIVMQYCWEKQQRRITKAGKKEDSIGATKRALEALKADTAFSAQEITALEALQTFWENLSNALGDVSAVAKKKDDPSFCTTLAGLFRQLHTALEAAPASLYEDNGSDGPQETTSFIARCDEIAKLKEKPFFDTYYSFQRHFQKIVSYFNSCRAICKWADSPETKKLFAEYGEDLTIVKTTGTPAENSFTANLGHPELPTFGLAEPKSSRKLLGTTTKRMLDKAFAAVKKDEQYNKDTGTLTYSKRTVHSEIGAIQWLITHDAFGRLICQYLGVSKLCCLLCFDWIIEYNKVMCGLGQPHKIIDVRGCHGSCFAPWCEPELKGATYAKQLSQSFNLAIMGRWYTYATRGGTPSGGRKRSASSVESYGLSDKDT